MTELNEKEKSHWSHKSQHYLNGDTFTTKIKVELDNYLVDMLIS